MYGFSFCTFNQVNIQFCDLVVSFNASISFIEFLKLLMVYELNAVFNKSQWNSYCSGWYEMHITIPDIIISFSLPIVLLIC